jgi:hypothetical protein
LSRRCSQAAATDNLGHRRGQRQFAAIDAHEDQRCRELFGDRHYKENVLQFRRPIVLQIGLADCLMECDFSSACNQKHGAIIQPFRRVALDRLGKSYQGVGIQSQIFCI